MEPIETRSDIRQRWLPAPTAEVFAAMKEASRLARWWGPAGFSSTIHVFEFVPGGRWLLTLHGPDGQDYPNESRFTRVVPDALFEIEHLNGHHFLLTITLEAAAGGTRVHWRQTFDTAEHYQTIAAFVATANAQNLDRLAAEVRRGQDAV
ncbi:MAG TPA: SRPBCC domain-containing protein [Thiobacillaceae bacterium]|nr:SRPBCC domain-containing protein [Thiobacillaceae bacterium]